MDPQKIYYMLASISLIGGAFLAYLAKRDRDQEHRFNEKLKQLSLLVDKAETKSDSRINAAKEEMKEVANRLAHVEREYISRGDHAMFRSELLGVLKDMGNQLNHTLDGFRASMEKLVDRINEVERR